MGHAYFKFNFVSQCWNIISLFHHFDRFPDPGTPSSTSLEEIGDLQPIGTDYKSDSSRFARSLNYSGCVMILGRTQWCLDGSKQLDLYLFPSIQLIFKHIKYIKYKTTSFGEIQFLSFWLFTKLQSVSLHCGSK